MSVFPTDRLRRIDAVFDAVLDLPSDEQTAFIERACADDPETRAEVFELLRAHRRSDGILESPAVRDPAPLLEVLATLGEPVSDRIGPFRVIHEIGRGGMGRVFLAERADGQFEQRVALKLIQYSTPGLVRRFVEERRILAMLEHPSIARLIDGGITDRGLPYFAMELVEGEPIDRYCDARNLTIDRRLELFAGVCDAVSYAHQHLIIHRDLKPSNILVRPDGQVKLLDFGIAKLLRADLTGDDATRTELQAMTPDFAAPEQVRGNPISTATDVYSLGVLLYVLLTGERPYDARGKSPAEIERIVCVEVPPKPSTKASPHLGRQLRGDLDLIVMTALQKQEQRRYQSPAALAHDLQHFRQGRAILARPDSTRYRLGKFVRRNRTGVVVAAATAASLVGATVFAFAQMQEARTQRQEAIGAARRATAMAELQSVLAGDTRDADGQPLSPAGRIAIAERVITARFKDEPSLVAGLMVELSDRFLEAGDLPAQRRMVSRARAIAQQAQAMSELALADCKRASGYWLDDQLDSARADILEAKAALATQRRSDPLVEAHCLEAEGKLLQATGSADSGVVLMKRALALAEAGPSGELRLGLANALADVLRLSGRTREAVPYFRRVLAELETQGYGDTEAFPNVVTFLWLSLIDLGEFVALDSSLRGFVRDREVVHGEGRVPTQLAFLYGAGKLRLGEIDSADVWIARAQRDTTQGSNAFSAYLPPAVADLRLEQRSMAAARVAVSQLSQERRGQRATTAMLRARLRRAEGDARGASALLERELAALLGDGKQRLTLFALPLVTAGEWRLADGDARSADSLARLARSTAAIDSVALVRSALAGRAELLGARALRTLGQLPNAREAAERAATALANGYGPRNAWTRAAQLLVDSLTR